MQVECSSLFINPDYPFIGASPDGLVSCLCCGGVRHFILINVLSDPDIFSALTVTRMIQSKNQLRIPSNTSSRPMLYKDVIILFVQEIKISPSKVEWKDLVTYNIMRDFDSHLIHCLPSVLSSDIKMSVLVFPNAAACKI